MKQPLEAIMDAHVDAELSKLTESELDDLTFEIAMHNMRVGAVTHIVFTESALTRGGGTKVKSGEFVIT